MRISGLIPQFFLVAVVAGLSVASPARGVVISYGDGSGNTSAPTSSNNFTGAGFDNVDFGAFNYWGNIGTVANAGNGNGSTAVYIGNGWVLTAAHVSHGNVTFTNGQTYNEDASTAVRLHNSDGTAADLEVFKLMTTPSLPNIQIATSAPAVNAPLLMTGNGWDRQPNITYWNSGWTETSSPSTYSGYKTQSGTPGWGVTTPSQHVRWGTNTVAGSTFDSGVNTQLFYSQFVSATHTKYEAQIVDKDSGGPAFTYSGGQWLLSGIAEGTGASGFDFNSQPNGSFTAVYWDTSFFSDTSTYRTEIINDTPEPASIGLFMMAVGGMALRRRRRAR